LRRGPDVLAPRAGFFAAWLRLAAFAVFVFAIDSP
jgi:hypothetical protein